jgi:riboflavin synthase
VVQGHVDVIGTVKKIEILGNSFDVYISVDKKHMPFIVPKGSITIDGISLTVNECYDDSFRLTIIPHTMKNTLFNNYKIGSRVNVETDMFARYVSHLLKHQLTMQTPTQGITWDDVDQINAHY